MLVPATLPFQWLFTPSNVHLLRTSILYLRIRACVSITERTSHRPCFGFFCALERISLTENLKQRTPHLFASLLPCPSFSWCYGVTFGFLLAGTI